MQSNRREFLKGLGAAALCAGIGRAASPLAAATLEKKNILFIMTDDHARHAIGAYGSKINHTPNMDALAKGGMVFENCISCNPICTPSRGCILSGMYSHKNGVPVFNDISPEIKTVAGYMRDAGYWTGFIGKWHLGGMNTVRESDWDIAKIYGGQGQYFDPWFMERKDGKVERTQYTGEYATENITRLTKDMLDEAGKSGKPFFVMMHHKSPHRNWLPAPKYHNKFRELTLKDIPMPESIYDKFEGRASAIKNTAMTLLHHMRLGMDLKTAEYFSEGHSFEFEGRKYVGQKNEKGEFVDRWPIDAETGKVADDRAKVAFSYLRYMQDYLACVQSVDDSIGEMVQYLKDHGLYENTVIFYTADQGFFLGDHGLYDKRFIMEETLQMPFIAHCPSLIEPGSKTDALISNVDFAETFLDIAGAAKPDAMQGKSFLSTLEGSKKLHRDACYARYYIEGGEHATAAWYGLRTLTDKLVYYYKRNEWEYFDLTKDAEEYVNAYEKSEYQERIAALKVRLNELRAELDDHDQFQNSDEYWPKD